ncbi:L-threonine ammonia-lyase [Octopus bimaculoides]|uniref:L-threonine ammonia-lyase n=1 Tax=Octopus bimaculoides TaxID=37653 RepID=UPI0022E84F3A|nr:L-threonine ammonia-lyase [Octopus bimaculoides]
MELSNTDLQPTVAEMFNAQKSMEGVILKTPLVPLNIDWPYAKIYLKLENLHPVGSFKIRNAFCSFKNLPPNTKAVYTVSTGNFARAVAWFGRRNNIKCTILVPDHAPKCKTDAVEKLGADIVRIEHKEWFEIIAGRKTYEKGENLGVYLHPEFDRNVLAGNGTVALEILQELPDVDTIIIPYGGGALSSGMGTAVKVLKPDVNIYTSEVDTSPQVYESQKAGKAVPCKYTPNFCDGIGGRGCMIPVWAVARKVIDDTIVVSTRDIADAIKLLVESNYVITEGAGASSVAAAMAAKEKLSGNVVCVVTGGNIDNKKLLQVLQGEIPTD